jgi:transporter family protein
MERIFLKYLEEYDSVATSAVFFLGASLTLLPILFFIPPNSFTEGLSDLRFAFLSSLIYSIGFYTYIKAISQEDASLIAPLYNSSLFWLLFLGYFFLDDDVGFFRVLGGSLMFIGVFFLYSGSFIEKFNAIKRSRGSLLMIFGSIFIAFGRTVDAYAVRTIDERLYAWSVNLFIGVIMATIAVAQGKTHIWVKIIHDKPREVFWAALTNGWGYLMLLFALVAIEVTVAVPVSLLSVFVTAFIAKRWLNENVEERIPGMIVMILGAFVLFL